VSTAYQKEMDASALRTYAAQIEVAFDGLPSLSVQAWDCPAADAFLEEASAESARLGETADMLRSVAASLDAAATAQRAAEAAAAAAAAAEAEAAASAVADPGGVGGGEPSNVF